MPTQPCDIDVIAESGEVEALFITPSMRGELDRYDFGDRQVAILGAGRLGKRNASRGFELVVMSEPHWYTVDVMGSIDEACSLAGELPAATVASNGIRTHLQHKRLHLTEDLALATGQATMTIRVLRVWTAPEESVYVPNECYRLSMNPGVIVPSGAKEKRQDEERAHQAAWVSRIIEDRTTAWEETVRTSNGQRGPSPAP